MATYQVQSAKDFTPGLSQNGRSRPGGWYQLRAVLFHEILKYSHDIYGNELTPSKAQQIIDDITGGDFNYAELTLDIKDTLRDFITKDAKMEKEFARIMVLVDDIPLWN